MRYDVIACTAALLAILAAPVLAQDAPVYDGSILTECLAAHPGADAPACAGKAADRCMASDAGSSTAGMGICLSGEVQQWDALLNADYKALMAQAKASDTEMADLGSAAPTMAEPLQKMQRDWMAFRDAACAYEASRWGGGTGGGPASTQCVLTQTARQVGWLRGYLAQEP